MEATVTLADSGIDQERLRADTGLLLKTLRKSGIGEVARAKAGPAPDGTRPADVTTIATLVAILSSPTVLKAFTDIVTTWLKSHQRGQITIEIGKHKLVITPTRKQQQELTDEFIARVRDSGDGETLPDHRE